MAAAAALWPANNPEQRPVAALRPQARNARTHSKEQVAEIAASMREWGWTSPVLIDEADKIIAGHGRVLAAHELGIVDIPVIVARGWTEAQKRAYVLADNQLALNAGWDEGLLRIELGELQAGGFNLALTGFGDDAIGSLLNPPGPPEPTVSLADRFGVPPFSVLRAAEGWWQNRKQAWLGLGIESELGRGDSGVNSPAPAGMGQAEGLIAVRAAQKAARHKANAAPGGSPRPLDRARAGKKSPMRAKAKASTFGTGAVDGAGGTTGDRVFAATKARRANAEPGGSKRPAADYGKTRARGDGAGKAVPNGKA